MCDTGKRNSKINWNREEELFLAQICQNEKKPSWSAISQELNLRFPSKNRTPKQCRERYINFVKSKDEDRGLVEWSQTQCTILYQHYLQKGSKWVQISKTLSGRSQNAIKNRFYGSVRKLIRKLNAIQRQKSIRNLKLMKQCTVMKLLDANSWLFQSNIQDSVKMSFIINLRTKVLEALKKLEGEEDRQNLIKLLEQLAVFKSIARFQTMKKLKTIHNSQKSQNSMNKQSIKWQASEKTENQQISEENCQNLEIHINQDKFDSGDNKDNQTSKELHQFDRQLNSFFEKNQVQKDLQFDINLILDINYECDRFNFEVWN